MHTVLIYSSGRAVDALLLSASPECLRAVIRGRLDTVEFRMIEGRWTSERGVNVEIGALLADDRMVAPQFVPRIQARTLSAV